MARSAPHSKAWPWRSRAAQRGAVALLTGVVFAVLFTLFLSVAISYHQNSKRQTRTTKYQTQAANVAQAGLTDAANWFRRQRVQPVTAFDPLASELGGAGQNQDPWKLDPGGAGNGLEHMGIVKEMEFEGEPNLWARYEVGKITHFQVDTSGNHVYSVLQETAPGSGVWEKKTLADADSTIWEGVQDVSANYGIDVPGSIWRIRSHGYIYRRDPKADPDTPFYQQPHQVLAHAELEIELNRLGMPALQAAVTGFDGQFIRFGEPPFDDDQANIIVKAPDGAMVHHEKGNPKPSAPKFPFNGAKNDYTTAPNNSLKLDPESIFGVPDMAALAQMADKAYTRVVDLPAKLPSSGFIYLRPEGGTATFTAARPMTGGGIMVIDGNLVLEVGNDSKFGGFLYVNGDYEQHAPSEIVGAIVVAGDSSRMNVYGESPTSYIEFNPDLLADLQGRFGYRERKVPLRRLE